MRKTATAWILALALCLMAMGAMADMPTADRAGNPIAVPAQVETIVSLAPSITQVILDIGLADRLVAVDTYSAWIPGVPEGLPAYDMMAPDMEQLIALAPDVVFVSGMSLVDGSDPFVQLIEAGTCVAYIPSSTSIAGICEDTLFIGAVAGDEAAAQGLVDTLMAAVDAMRVQTDDPTPVYFEVGSSPSLYSFGSDTFLDEMIELLGGMNIFADQEGWIVASDEAVVAAAPEIIFTNEDWSPSAVDDILARAGWDSIPAVQEGAVYLIGSDASSQPNHRIVIALEEMATAFKK